MSESNDVAKSTPSIKFIVAVYTIELGAVLLIVACALAAGWI